MRKKLGAGALALGVLLQALPAWGQVEFVPTTESSQRTGFWVGSNHGTVFDSLTVHALHAYGYDVSVLNLSETEQGALAPLSAVLSQEELSKYDYRRVVARFKGQEPSRKLLAYTWSRFGGQTGKRVGFKTAGEDAYARFFSNVGGRDLRVSHGGQLLVREERGSRDFYADYAYDRDGRSPAVDYLVDRVRAKRSEYGVDGYGFDLSIADPRHDFVLAEKARARPGWARDYTLGVLKMFRSVSEGRAGSGAGLPMLTAFNGMMHHANGKLGFSEAEYIASQRRILSRTHGALLEFFGGRFLADGRLSRKSFRQLLRQIDVWYEHRLLGKRKFFLVTARGPKGEYWSYDREYLWARYLYTTYLLGAGTNTAFKYSSTYQVPTRAGRVDGLAVHGDTLLSLGEPRGAYAARADGSYTRRFQRGHVLVNPEGNGAAVTWRAPQGRTHHTLDGRAVTELRLAPGRGEVLFKSAPMVRAGLRNRFREERFRSVWKRDPWVLSGLVQDDAQETGARRDYLRLQELPAEVDYLHDLKLFTVRVRRPRRNATVLLRAPRPSDAQVVLVAEVDDRQQEHTYAQFVLGGPTHAEQYGYAARKFFRAPTRPLDEAAPIPTIVLPRIANKTGWQRLQLDPDDVFAGHSAFRRYRYKRWHFVRFVGGMDVGEVKVGSSGFLSP